MSRRSSLSPKKILGAALDLADEGGMEGVALLSMRKLAAALGVEAMSLYNHIKNKEDLVSLMVDWVFGEYQVPSPDPDWRRGLEARARSMYKTLQAHSWAALTLLPRVNIGDNQFEFSNQSFALLEAGGYSLPEADRILVTIDSYTYGYFLWELTFPIPQGEYSQAAQHYLSPELEARFPVMARAAAMVAKGEYDGVNDFEYGLRVVLKGFPSPQPEVSTRGQTPGVFEMLKIGIGPSSSHTLGPWRAAQKFLEYLKKSHRLAQVSRIRVELYGSLALTGKGHGTDIAIILGLSGTDPVTIQLSAVVDVPERVRKGGTLFLDGTDEISYDPRRDLSYHKDTQLPGHPNGIIFIAENPEGRILLQSTAYSIGGGFVVFDGEKPEHTLREVRFDVSTGASLLAYCQENHLKIADIARANELIQLTEKELDQGLQKIWQVMKDGVHRGCSSKGLLPGGLQVHRRAPDLIARVTGVAVGPDAEGWYQSLGQTKPEFARTLKLVGTFAMAVNEENASFGRIVTAPTNGSAGVIPAVLLYYRYFSGREVRERDVADFLLVAGLIGGIFKTGATISAAMGGCQAEIGVSSAMAAAALTEGLGGTPEQSLMAAEIAMEHHLGLTCDPIGGLVQIPCIERNSMGAIKAITAAHLALESDTARAKVSLDAVVQTMWATAQDMNTRYKETSLGGLAVNVAVNIPEC